jgi:hypothetical protein
VHSANVHDAPLLQILHVLRKRGRSLRELQAEPDFGFAPFFSTILASSAQVSVLANPPIVIISQTS